MAVEDLVTGLIEKAGGSKKIMQTVTKLIDEHGGVAGLVQQFTKAGHGEKASSWVAAGPNKPITGDEVAKTLGDAKVEEAAREAGISKSEAQDQLAKAIPGVVNELTPEGKLPEGKLVEELVGKLKGLVG